MKYCIFQTFLVVGVVFGQTALPDFIKEQAECVTELNLDSSKIRKLSDFDKEITHDEKCVMRCVFQKSGMIDKNGVPIEDEVDKQIAKAKNIDFMSKCAPAKSITDPCEQTYALTGCVLNLLQED